MDFISNLQSSIDYIEEHILEQISYEDVAKYLYISSYHFHRTFSMMIGMTANEYIRNRRLSMAGQELSMSKAKVIDIAYKYGYDSPESFTKAFTRFHDVTPSLARRTGMTLKSFNRLLIKIKLEGGRVMDYKIEKREQFKVLAKTTKFRNVIISEDGNTEIPDFWKECGENGTFSVLRSNTKKHDIYGVCAPISKESTYFDYGVRMEYDSDTDIDGYTIWVVKPTLWAVFTCIGETGECISDTWKRIFSEFLPNSEYAMLDDVDFEFYPENRDNDIFCEIWIPVEKK